MSNSDTDRARVATGRVCDCVGVCWCVCVCESVSVSVRALKSWTLRAKIKLHNNRKLVIRFS